MKEKIIDKHERLKEYSSNNPKEASTVFYGYLLLSVLSISYITQPEIVVQGFIIPIWVYISITALVILPVLWYRRLKKIKT